ncbi:hypothetical protein [Pseudoflavonifractor sp. 60]|uniref:hypothetical protein n=1 Tax=Pseudoflavonifractor sp. 60 TaxID=2304576 RepID=UPI00136CB4D0|nr:hypothetical protein [Pseudoflavonifractor sp. 60]
MLTWNDTPQKDQTGKVISVSYTASIPHWGEARIHPHIRHPGEMFLDCPSLGIEMQPLGRVFAEDAITPAERALMTSLEQHGIWCLEAMAAIGTPEY